MKILRQFIECLKGLFRQKAKEEAREDVETAVSKSIPLEEAYKLWKKQHGS